MSDFDFQMKPRRPLWKDMLLFVLTVGGVWGGTHVFLNFSAFAQIAEHKITNLKASMFRMVEEKEVQAEPRKSLPLKRVQGRKRAIFRDKSLQPKSQSRHMFETMPLYPSDNRIFIPRIRKNVPLITVPNHNNWQQLEQNIQKGLQDGVVVHPISRDPASFGNFFITGHSSYYKWDPGRFKDVFALLHEVEEGDRVEVYWEGKKYEYIMKLKQVVPPTAVEVLSQPKKESILTLMTCTPVGTNKKRLVLVGELLE